MGEWQLFVDESGCFDSASDHVTVAGILVEGTDTPELQRGLRACLDQVFPLAAYPPHAAEQASIAFVASDAYGRPERAAKHGLGDVRDRLDALGPEVGRFLETVKGSRKEGFKLAHDVEWRIQQREPGLASSLLAIVDEQASGIVELVKALSNARHTEVLVAAESNGASTGADRYITLLENVLERVRLRLDRVAGPTKVWAHVLKREVTDGGAGSCVPLHTRHVALAAKAARCGLDQARLRVVPLQTSDFVETCHPGLVLADFAANRSRHAVGRPQGDRSIDEVSQSLRARLGLSAFAEVPGIGLLPTVAASGLPRDAIRAAEQGGLPLPFEAVRPRWAREQTQQWVRALTALGAGGQGR